MSKMEAAVAACGGVFFESLSSVAMIDKSWWSVTCFDRLIALWFAAARHPYDKVPI
jgi:hypothetical protein